jgi:hypothetical protein
MFFNFAIPIGLAEIQAQGIQVRILPAMSLDTRFL